MSQPPRYGLAMAMAVPCAYAVTSSMARIAYDSGATPLAVASTRQFAAALVFLAFALATRMPSALPPRQRHVAWVLGAAHAVQAWVLYMALARVPVAIAILIFYTFPLLTGIWGWISGDERPTGRTVGSVFLAFAGIGLTLDLGAGTIDMAGAGLAALSALAFAAILVVTGKLFRGGEARPRTLHMLVAGALTYLALVLLTGEATYPSGAQGWTAMATNAAFYCFAVIGMFASVAALGPMRAAMFLNLEPVVTLAMGWFLLNQGLGPVQLLGAGMVIVAVLVYQHGDAPAQAPKPGGN